MLAVVRNGIFVLFVCCTALVCWKIFPRLSVNQLSIESYVAADSTVGPQNEKLNLPNVLFMMVDDLGYGDVHYNGGKADTPNVDAMAAGPNSVHLTRYYAAAPVCSPTRGSVLTGRNPNRYCIWGPNTQGLTADDFTYPQKMPLPETEISVAEILRQHGYRTGIFGKWHIGDLSPVSDDDNETWPVSHPGMFGFEKWFVTPGSSSSLDSNCGCFSSSCCPRGHYDVPMPCRNYYHTDSVTGNLLAYPKPIHNDDSLFIVSLLEDFLKEVTGTGQPFFAYLPFHTVHIRYIADRKYREKYLSRGYTLDQADYYGAISSMDEAVGRVRQLLEVYGVRENTMLWFTSDNGPQPSTPGETARLSGHKYTLWEGGIRVPGIIEWPDVIKRNHKSDFPVVSNDLLPTVCDILGIHPPTDRVIDGTSILPLLYTNATTRNKSIAWAFKVLGKFDTGNYQAAISSDQHKLIGVYDRGKLQEPALYDIVNDPFEQHDISAKHPDVFESMKMELEQWRLSVRHSALEEVKCCEKEYYWTM